MMYDAVWTLAKSLDELSTMKELKVERVNCEQGRRNTPGKRSADEVLKKLLEVSLDMTFWHIWFKYRYRDRKTVV